MDDFIGWWVHVFEFIRPRIKAIAWTFGIVAGVFLIFMLVDYIQDVRIKNAAEALYKTSLSSEDKSKALEGVAESYGSTPSGRIAIFELGDEFAKNGNYEAALKEFDKLTTKEKESSLMVVAALYRKAQIQLLMEKYEDAAKTYLEAANNKANINRADSFYHAASCYEKLKNFDEAENFYKKAIENSSESDVRTKSRSEERLLWLVAQKSNGN